MSHYSFIGCRSRLVDCWADISRPGGAEESWQIAVPSRGVFRLGMGERCLCGFSMCSLPAFNGSNMCQYNPINMSNTYIYIYDYICIYIYIYQILMSNMMLKMLKSFHCAVRGKRWAAPCQAQLSGAQGTRYKAGAGRPIQLSDLDQ